MLLNIFMASLRRYEKWRWHLTTFPSQFQFTFNFMTCRIYTIFIRLSEDVNSNVLIQSDTINANASPASDSTRSANVSISTSAKLWTSAAPAPHNASTPQDPTSASARMDLSSRATKANASRLKTNANPWRWRTDMLAVPDRGRMRQ